MCLRVSASRVLAVVLVRMENATRVLKWKCIFVRCDMVEINISGSERCAGTPVE